MYVITQEKRFLNTKNKDNIISFFIRLVIFLIFIYSTLISLYIILIKTNFFKQNSININHTKYALYSSERERR